MSTFTQILYHIVFSTTNRERTLSVEKCPDCSNTFGVLLRTKVSSVLD